MILADKWDRMFEDPIAEMQRWYCNICGTRYLTKYGVLIEIGRGNMALYCQGEIPPQCLYDARGMLLAMKYSMCKTPEALLDALPQIKPLGRGQFLTDVGGGVYSFNKESFRGLPKFEWNQLYNLPEVEENLRAASPPQRPMMRPLTQRTARMVRCARWLRGRGLGPAGEDRELGERELAARGGGLLLGVAGLAVVEVGAEPVDHDRRRHLRAGGGQGGGGDSGEEAAVTVRRRRR